MKKTPKFLVIFAIVFAWLFFGWPQAWHTSLLPPTIKKIQAEVAPLKIKDKTIDFAHTDDNSNENLIIKTDEKTYVGLTRSEIYFSVTNISDEPELVNIQIYFPENKGKVKNIKKWTEDISYEVDVPDYGSVDYSCKDGWEKKSSDSHSPQSEEGTPSSEFWKEGHYYQCPTTSEKRTCDTIKDKECHIEKTQIDSHKEIKHKDGWKDIKSSDKSLSTKKKLTKKLLGKGIKRKSIPSNLKVKKSTKGDGHQILSGETQYFKMEIGFPKHSSGEFYIEAIGDKKGYGLLDPWWSSSWDYKKAVDITYSGSSLSNYQVKITTDTQSLISAGKMQSDCDDIRMIDSDEGSGDDLDYWIEDNTCNTASTNIWVEIPSISGNKTIYMYYNNSSATSAQSGDNTFLFFDNFPGSSLNTTKWAHNGGTYTISNSEFDGDAPADWVEWVRSQGSSPYQISDNKIIQFRMQPDGSTGDFDSGICIGEWKFTDETTSGGNCMAIDRDKVWGDYTYSTSARTDNNYHTYRIVLNGSTAYFYDDSDGRSFNSNYGGSYDPTGYIYLFGDPDGSGINTKYQWIFVREYSSTEPIISVGNEQIDAPNAPIFYSVGGTEQLSFNNIKQNTTTPRFRASSTYSTNFDRFNIELNTQADFTGTAYTQTFSGTYTSGTPYNLLCDSLSPSLPTTDGITYFVRARASSSGGSDWGIWSTETWSFTYTSTTEDPVWFQTTDEQFDADTLTNTETTGSDSVQLGSGASVKSNSGTFDTPSSTGNQVITGIGFQPKAVMFFAVPRTDESAGSHSSQFVGFSDGTNHKSFSIKSEDGVNDNGRSQYNYAIHLRNIDTTNLAVATVNSFDSDGFTLNYTTTNSGYYIHYIAFGGDTLTAVVGEEGVGSSPLSGLSFAPDIMFLATAGNVTTSNDDSHGIHSFGVVNDSSFWHRGSHQGSNNTTKDSLLTTSSCLTQTYNNSLSWQMTNCSLTSDGMTWSGTNTDEFGYLALNVGSNDTEVGTFTKETSGTSGATQDLTGWGFTNDSVVVGFTSAGKTAQTLSDHVHFTHGSYDGTNQEMIGVGDRSATTTSRSIQNNDYAIGIIDYNASIVAGGTVSDLDNDGVRITWSPNNTTAYRIGYWAVEGATPTTGSVLSTEIDYDSAYNMSSWNELTWNDTETNSDLKYQIQYWDGDSWELVPDGTLSGNSTGFDDSPVDLSGLNTTTYNRIKVKANFTHSGNSPALQDWTITWIEAGTLGVDIVDSGGIPVNNPSVSFSSATFDWSEQQTSGILGVTDEKIRITNATTASAWSLTISATDGTDALWSSGTYTYDFNGTIDNGRLEVDPLNGIITPQSGCSATGISKGSAAYFDSGNNITLLTADGTTGTNCWWDFTAIDLEQDIPSEQEAGSYSIQMTLTAT